jgi:hypothetical protein
MSVLNKVETMVSGWLKPVPHLPKGGQKWIAENAWWIVLIGVVASAIGILVAIGAIFTYLAFVGNAASYYGVYTTSVYGGGWIVSTIVSLAFSVALLIVTAMAVKPLKAQQRQGWSLLFIGLVLRTLSVVLGAILSFSVLGFIFGLIFGAIGLAIYAYFLYEIKSHFVGTGAKAVHHKTTKK